MRALREGSVDVAVGLDGRPAPDLRRRALLRETYRVVARRDHPRLRTALTLDAFCAERHVLVAPGGTARGIADRALEATGRSRTIAVATAGFLPALTVVATSDMIATVPTRLTAANADRFGLRVFEPPVAVRPFTVAATRHARADADPAVRWLVDEIARCVASGGVGRPAGASPGGDAP